MRRDIGLENSKFFNAAERGWVTKRLAELLGWGGAVRSLHVGGRCE